MVAPLIIASAITSAVRGISGALSAGANARRQRDLIKRAYKIAQAKQERDQSFTRQDTNESLNQRGMLNAGDGGAMPTTGAIADAYKGKALNPTKSKLVNSMVNPGISTENFNEHRMAVSSTQGSQGYGYSAGVNRDLSNQFYDEQKDLWMAREQAINATKGQQSQDTVNAIGNGIQTGMDVYNAGSSLMAGRSGAAATAAGSSGPVSIRGAFGIDPVNPLGNNQSLSGFDFNIAGKPDPNEDPY